MAFGSEFYRVSVTPKDVGVVEWGLAFCSM